MITMAMMTTVMVTSEVDDQRLSQEGFPKQFFSSSINGELESCRWNLNAGDNIPYAHSVLCPIENLSQWKAAKAKAAAPRHQRRISHHLKNQEFFTSESSLQPV
ncbi:hypothetical protein M0R45_000126 [Rubus argutus]|uniref:Uncharacterized protein n=1 Tax=Rubus argutus TaxID=59490 RepID=A0AAW1VML9_RUBAR